MTSIDATDDRARRSPARQGASRLDQALVTSGQLQRRDRLFRRARRHTGLVRALRVVFPLCVLASFGFYAIILKTSFSVGPGTLVPGKIEVTADDLKMKNPSYFGVTSDNGKYEVRAREAAVDFAMTGPIKLESIDGDLFQASGVKTNLKSTRGNLDNKSGELELYDGVDIHASNGMTAHLIRAMVKTKEHFISTRDPLVADMPTGKLTANSMDFWTDKKIGHFSNNVTLRLIQQAAPGAAQPSISLGGDQRQPVDIRSRDLDIDDGKSIADFKGQVVATQGETQLTAPFLHVTYEGHATLDQAAGQTAASAAPSTTQPAATGSQLSRLEAYPGIVITAGVDRRLIADRVDFDVKADTALFTGNVELQQAKNVFRGGRMHVDRKAGKTRLDTPGATPKAPPGRVFATLIQSPDPAKPAPAAGKGKAAAPPAETAGGLGGLQRDPNAPTDIEADTLDVNDQTKQAIFRGHTIAKQGEYTITSAELVAFYTGQTGLLASSGNDAAPKGAAAPAGAQLSHIETHGGTKIVSKDGKEAEGQNARFDVKANTVTMDGPGGVVLKQNGNKINGCRLNMDMTTGEAHVENCPDAPGTVVAPTAAQASIAAKAGIAPPTQPTDCPPGRMCAVLHPDDLQKSSVTTKDGQVLGAKQKVAPAQGNTVIPPAASPQISPSPVYRSN